MLQSLKLAWQEAVPGPVIHRCSLLVVWPVTSRFIDWAVMWYLHLSLKNFLSSVYFLTNARNYVFFGHYGLCLSSGGFTFDRLKTDRG
jgi:hypothetical protein